MSLISQKKNMNPFYQEFEFFCPVCSLKVEKGHKCHSSIKRRVEKVRRRRRLKYGNDFFRRRNR